MRRGAFVVPFLLAMPLRAQTPVPDVAPITNLSASVRAAGMAGAAVALTGDAAVMFDNPAIIGPIRHLAVEIGYARLPDDRWYSSSALALRAGPVSVGGGLRYLRYPDADPLTDNLEWVAATSIRLRGVHLGASADYVSIEDSTGAVRRTLTQDLGVMVAFFDIAGLALSFENLGRTSLSGDRLMLPARTHLGFSLNLIDTYSNGRLVGLIETVWTDGEARRTILGLEAGVVLHGIGLVARIGHGAAPAGSGVGSTSYGGSLVLGRARVDYAYQHRSAIGRSVHLVGMHWTP
ncbi:MAG TPA: hypothetical protein VFN22_04815 [Gemmatimonadales bacterium]|nr:hypothetical protein [Gemmatimonadales bacterium]